VVKEVDLRPTGYQAAWVRTPSAPNKPFGKRLDQKQPFKKRLDQKQPFEKRLDQKQPFEKRLDQKQNKNIAISFGATFFTCFADKGWGLMELGYLFAEKLYHSTLY
jgi:hypothetical protein